MLIHNTTFMMLREREGEFLTWFRTQLPALTGAEPLHPDTSAAAVRHAVRPRLSAMREAGGVSHLDDMAQSIAFQVEFPDMESLRAWADGPMAAVIDAFQCRFGPDAMTFTSIFESLPLQLP